MAPKTKTAPTKKYKRKPKFPPGTFDDLHDALQYLILEDVFDLLQMLGMHNQLVRDDSGQELTIADIICVEGSGVVAAESRRYYFYGGPERVIDTSQSGDGAAFQLIHGTVLQWLLDCILFRMTYDGWDVTRKLGLPL